MTVTTTPEAPPTKVVLVVRDRLPINLAINAAAVLGATIGTRLSLPLGPDASDASGTEFSGIVTTPVPVLAADDRALTDLFGTASSDEEVHVVTLTEVARQARTYESYVQDLAQTRAADTDIVALCVAGPRSRVTKLTKRLALLSEDVRVGAG